MAWRVLLFRSFTSGPSAKPRGATTGGFSRSRVPRPLGVHRLRHLGGLPGRSTTPTARTCRRSTRRSCSGRLAARLVRPAAVVVAGLAAVLAGAADPVGARRASGSPATTTAARTTRRSGPTRPPAPSASRARATSARATGRCGSRTSTATSCTSRCCSSSCSPCDAIKAFWFADGLRHRRRHARADART